MNTIYTYGGGEVLFTIFNGVAAFMNGGYMNTIILFSLGVGSVFFVLKTIGVTNALTILPRYWIPMLVMVNVLFVPQTRIVIQDKVQTRQYVVENVPLFLGVFAGACSKFGESMREAFESVFSLPDNLKYGKKGMVFASQLIDQTREFRVVDETLRSNLKHFCRQCVVLDGLLTKKYSIDQLKSSPNIWGMIETNASSLRGIVWVDDNKSKTFMTCKEAAVKFKSLWQAMTRDAAQAWGGKLFGLTVASVDPKVELLKYLPEAYNYMTSTSKSATEWMTQILMINTIKDSHWEKYGMSDKEKTLVDRARAQYQGSWKSMGYTAGQYLPVLKSVMEGILYAFVLVILPFMMFPNGWRYIYNWAITLLWIQLWPVTYAIIHFFLMHFAEKATKNIKYSKLAEGLTIKTQLALVDTHWEFVAVAGILMMVVPSLTYALIKGGAGQFVHIAGNFLGGMQAPVSSGYSELLKGNVSWGNTQYRNMGWGSKNLDQVNTAATLNAGYRNLNMGTGSRITDFKDNSIVEGKSSMGPTGVNLGQAFNQSIGKQVSTGESVVEQRGKEFSDSLNKSVRTSNEFSERFNNDESFREGVSQNLGTAYNRSHSRVEALTAKFANESKTSHGLASKLIASAGAGVNIGIFQAGLRAEGSTEIVDQSVYSKAQDLTNSQEYRSAIADERRYAQDISQGTSNSEVRSWAESQLGAKDEVLSSAERFSASRQRLTELRETESYAHTHTGAINHNANNDFLKYLEKQSLAKSGAPMGRRAAEKMFMHGGSQVFPYIKKFTESHMHETQKLRGQGISMDQAWERARQTVVNRQETRDLDKVSDRGLKRDVIGNVQQGRVFKDHVAKERAAGKSVLDAGHREIKQGKERVVKLVDNVDNPLAPPRDSFKGHRESHSGTTRAHQKVTNRQETGNLDRVSDGGLKREVMGNIQQGRIFKDHIAKERSTGKGLLDAGHQEVKQGKKKIAKLGENIDNPIDLPKDGFKEHLKRSRSGKIRGRFKI